MGVLPRNSMACRASTRPRMVGSARSCTIAVDEVRKPMLGEAHHEADGHRHHHPGERAKAAMATPKATALRPTVRTVTRVRRATRQGAHQGAEAEHGEEHRERGEVAAELAGDEQRHHGGEVERQRPDDRHHHQRHPQGRDAVGVAQALAHLAPARGLTGAGRSSGERISASETSTATYDRPSARNAQPNPAVATSSPATAGPITRDEVMRALSEADGVGHVDLGHHLHHEARRAGLSNATVIPPTAARA